MYQVLWLLLFKISYTDVHNTINKDKEISYADATIITSS